MLTGLEPNTTYSFRAFAMNDSGMGMSDLLSFTTDFGVVDYNYPLYSVYEYYGIDENIAINLDAYKKYGALYNWEAAKIS